MQKLPKLRTALTLLGLTVSIGLTGTLAASAKTTDAPGLRSIAFEHYLSGDTEAALDYYQKAIDTASRDYGADSSYIGQLYYEMGTLALDAKKFVRSESYLQKAVDHNPNSVMARVKFAELLQLRGKNDEALQQIHAALAKHSSSPEAREALVIWLQSNHKIARAIHESYNISVAAAGNTVAPPVMTVVAAKTEPTKASDNALIAASAPAAATSPTAPAAKVPLKIFPWMQVEKKPEPKKPEPEKKPPEKKEEKKPVESKKPEKKAKKEPKQQKPAKEKHAKPAKQQQVQVAQEEMHASAAALRTTAKTLPKKKEVKSGDDPAESGGSEEAAAPAAKAKHVTATAQQAPAMVFGVPAVKSSKRSPNMVPPPPPMVPVFGNPMGMFQAPPPAFHQPAKVAKKPKSAAAAVAKEPAPEPKSTASSGGSEEDPGFLLEWGGVNGKKKGK